jgi:hypothetical protein
MRQTAHRLPTCAELKKWVQGMNPTATTAATSAVRPAETASRQSRHETIVSFSLALSVSRGFTIQSQLRSFAARTFFVRAIGR